MTSENIENCFTDIDNALELYYTRLGHEYPKNNGMGLFMQHIIDEELLDPDVPIECELGDECHPTDCAYTWMQSDFPLPIPPNINISEHKKEVFFFYLLQYCYKHSKPPSDSYIRSKLLSKVDQSTPSISHFNQQAEPEPEAAYSMLFQSSLFSETSHSLSSDNKRKHWTESAPFNIEGVDDTNVITINPVDQNQATRLSQHAFVPKCGHRAYLNIFTPKQLTMTLYGVIKEKFVDNAALYYYIDISVGLQMNDGQMKVYKLLMDNQECMVSVVNCDLHIKGTAHELFGIIVPNEHHFDEQGKWQWRFSEFLTMQQILLKYGITFKELPISSRKMPKFVEQLRQKIVINETLIDDTKWFAVPQIKSAKKNGKKQVANITITLSTEMWMKECKKAFENIDFPLIPIVVHKQNKHWIEWVKIIYIASQNIYVGVACKYMEENGIWRVESICLDAGDIYNKHRLIGLYNERYMKQLRNFQTSITKIIFSDHRNKMEEKVSSLKQQIKYQQDSISRLKGCILKINNGDNEEKKGDDEPVLEEAIKSFIEDEEIDNSVEDDDDVFFERIVDDVIKTYQGLAFRTKTVGAKSNIYINKQFIKSWLNYVTPRFNDEAMMYYWLDYTISMQMIQGYSQQYVNKENGKFMVAIINSELMDKNGEILYGMIMLNNNNNNNGGKYRYKLTMLMTKEEIYKEYGINGYDLPKKSRKHCDFVADLLLPRKIMDVDVKQINWANVKLFKSRTNGNNDGMGKALTIFPNVLIEYITIAVDRMNNKHGNDENLVPILSIDKNNNDYGVEWVLMVYIIHRDCYIGVSFKFDGDNNLFVVKGIYLDNIEIELKHKLVGLAYNYTKNMPSFSLKRFKIKARRRDDGEIIMDYKIKIENEKLKNRELEEAMNNQKQVQMQHIQYLRQQNQQRTHYQYQ